MPEFFQKFRNFIGRHFFQLSPTDDFQCCAYMNSIYILVWFPVTVNSFF